MDRGDGGPEGLSLRQPEKIALLAKPEEIPSIPRVQTSGIAKTLLLLSGWAIAGWLLVAPRVEPIAISFDARPEPPVSSAGMAEESEPARIFREWSEDSRLDGAALALCLLDEHGTELYASPLAETAMCPASALKTVTSAAALDLLGPEYRFETALAAATAPDAGGVLAGNLVLLGGGDPTLSTGDLTAMAEKLAAQGVKRVTGRVIADASVFPPRGVNDHWNWGDIGNAYGAGAYGLNVNHNRLEISFKPAGRVGWPAELADTPVTGKETRWINRVSTGPHGSGDQVTVYSEPYGSTITLQGTVPHGEESFTITGALPDPPAAAADLMTRALKSAGVSVAGEVLPTAGSDLRKLVVHRSAPLPEIIDHLHRVSDNLEAQCLFLMIGRVEKKEPAEALRRYWEKQGVFFKGLRLIDGSGLARATMIRPVDLARINHLARRGPHGERFRASLTSYSNGAARAKLGAMSGVKTEVGFLTLADGKEATYVLMANGLDPALDYWPMRERLLLSLR